MQQYANNPVGNISRDLFDKPIKSNYAHATDRKTLALQPYVFLRSRELAGLRWDEIDLDQKTIEISAERMKKKRPHLVDCQPVLKPS